MSQNICYCSYLRKLWQFLGHSDSVITALQKEMFGAVRSGNCVSVLPFAPNTADRRPVVGKYFVMKYVIYLDNCSESAPHYKLSLSFVSLIWWSGWHWHGDRLTLENYTSKEGLSPIKKQRTKMLMLGMRKSLEMAMLRECWCCLAPNKFHLN